MVDARSYHESTKHHPDTVGNRPEAMDPRYKPRPSKRYRDLPTRSLPAGDPISHPALSLTAQTCADTAFESKRLDLSTIASICVSAAGITQEFRTPDGQEIQFRAAPCTGKLYHNELYLAIGSVSGIEPGLYHFDPTDTSLTVLRTGDVRRVIQQAVGDPSDALAVSHAPVSILLTSEWWRNAWKYTERTYRHAFWDGGAMVGNLLAASHGCGLRCLPIVGFDDERLVELLAIDPTEEAPLGVVALGSGDAPPSDASLRDISPETVPVSDGRFDYPLIYDAWNESTLASRDSATQWREDVRRFVRSRDEPLLSTDAISLDSVGDEIASQRPLSATIQRRGSCREYTESGPSRRMVGTVLHRSLGGAPGDWNGGEADGLSVLTPYLLIDGVQEIPSGSYRYHHKSGAIERVGTADAATMRKLALDQPWAGDAHVNVYLMADIESIVEAVGNRGYRLAQFEAGISLGRLYLATYAHRQLGGTGLTFYDDLVTDHLSPDAAGTTPMCLFAFGNSAQATAEQ